MKKLKLLKHQIEALIHLPETGMGYQKVKLIFRNGEILNDITVLNSELLLIKDDQSISADEIDEIELES